MNLALFNGVSPYRLPAPVLASEQVNFGPGLPDAHVAGRVFSQRTPTGLFDAAAAVNRLSATQKPDAVAVLIDGAPSSWPCGIARIRCPKALLIASLPTTPEASARLAAYLRTEPFDRVVCLSDRSSALQLAQQGLRDLTWLPGWAFPHSDATIARARVSRREMRIAVCGRAGMDDRRLLRLTASLARQMLPVHARMAPELEVPAHYGASVLALVDGAAGFDLRLAPALAVGAAVLCLRPRPDHRWDLPGEAPEIAFFDRPEELVARAAHWISHPADANQAAVSGATWFNRSFSAQRRQAVFEAMVLDSQVPAEFALVPTRPAPSVADRSEPPAAVSAPPADAAGDRAIERLETGDKQGALELAQNALVLDQDAWKCRLVVAELALESGRPELWRQMLAQARAVVPNDDWLARLELGSTPFLVESRVAAMLGRAWKAWENGDCLLAGKISTGAVHWKPDCAEAYLLAGLSGLVQVRTERKWMQHGPVLNLLELAADANPDRPDIWSHLAFARRKAGGTMVEAVPAYRRAVALDPDRIHDWFGLGEVLLTLGDAEGACVAFEEALRRAPESAGLWDWMGFAHKRQGRLRQAEACHLRALGGDDRAAQSRPSRGPDGRRRVVFVVQNGHGWPCFESIHAEFVRDPSWEVIVVGLPWQHPSFANSSHKDQDRIFDFLTGQGIPHVRWTDFPLTENQADLVFLQNPYDSTRPAGWKAHELIRAGHRLCYVPYGIEIGSDRESLEYQFDMTLHRYAWAVFARSEAHRELFGQHCAAGNAHVAVTGHPKFEVLGRAGAVAPDPSLVEFARGRPLVLWNPHFDARLNGTRFGNGFSTFMRWKDFIPEEISRRPDIAFVLRPHPNFFSALEERGLLTRPQAARFLERCEQAGILVHRSPDYFPVLAAADALISDGSSLLIEFGISGKPVCYLHNPDGPLAHPDYELDLDYVRQHCTWATSEQQIRGFLNGLDTALADEAGREMRAAELRRRMGVGEGSIGGRIKHEIERRLALDLPVPELKAG